MSADGSLPTGTTAEKPGLSTGASIDAPTTEWTSDIIAEVLAKLGIKYLSLVPGASFRGLHDSIVNYLGNRNPEMVVALHEGHAVSIADGYGRATGQPMAVALHSNVGLMHGSMAIFNAWCARSPMIVIGATGPVDAHKRRPWIDWIHTSKDQASMIRNYVKWDDQPASAEASIESLLRGNQIARTAPNGPVYICLDAEMQEAPLREGVVVPPIERFRPAPSPTVPQETLDAIIAAIKAAQFPVLLVGRVSRSESDWANRVRLAEAIGGAVFTTLLNPAGFPTEHPLHVAAPCGEKHAEHEAEVLKDADLVISLDWHDLAGFLRARLGQSQTQRPTTATVVHCSADSYATNGWSMDHQALAAVDIPALADPDVVVKQLLDEIDRRRESLPLSQGRTTIQRHTHWSAKIPTSGPANDDMALHDFALTIDSFACTHAAILARLPLGWPGYAAHFRGPQDYMGKDAGGAVGTGPGHAVGIALAFKDSERPVMAVLGDGDFLMGANALWTASHMELPMMIIVANNRAFYNDVVHQEFIARQRRRSVANKWVGQDLSHPTPDLVGMAKSQGFEGIGPVRSADELMRALLKGAAIVAAGGQFLIDAHISRD